MGDFRSNIETYIAREKEIFDKLSIEDINQVMNVLEDARKRGCNICVWKWGDCPKTQMV